MTPLSIRLSLVLVASLSIVTWLLVPHGIAAARWLAAQDDPVALSDLALERNFDAAIVRREVEAALAANDVELAESFVELARERNIAIDPAIAERVAAQGSGSAVAARSVGQFVRGFVIGEPDDLASLAGTATGDLFVFGDAR